VGGSGCVPALRSEEQGSRKRHREGAFLASWKTLFERRQKEKLIERALWGGVRRAKNMKLMARFGNYRKKEGSGEERI